MTVCLRSVSHDGMCDSRVGGSKRIPCVESIPGAFECL